MLRSLFHHCIHGLVCDHIGRLNHDIFALFHQLFQGVEHDRLVLCRLSPVVDQRNALRRVSLLRPVCLCCRAKLRIFLTDFLIVLQKLRFRRFLLRLFHGNLLFLNTAFLPDGSKILLQLLKRLSISLLRLIDEDLPIRIDSGLPIPQENVIGISSAQQVHGIIGDEILVMHPVIPF